MNWDHLAHDAQVIRDCEDMGAVHLERRSGTGFGSRPQIRRVAPRAVSPGSGGNADSGFYQWPYPADQPQGRRR